MFSRMDAKAGRVRDEITATGKGNLEKGEEEEEKGGFLTSTVGRRKTFRGWRAERMRDQIKIIAATSRAKIENIPIYYYYT